MYKKVTALAGALALTVGLSGCLVAPVMPPMGMIFTDYKAPLDYDQQASQVGTLQGRSETMSILGLVALGDGSIREAARDGGITTIHGADYEYFNVVGIYQRYTTIVYGE